MSYLEDLGDLWVMFEKTVNDSKSKDKSKARAATFNFLIFEILNNSRAEAIETKNWNKYNNFVEDLRKAIYDLGI